MRAEDNPTTDEDLAQLSRDAGKLPRKQRDEIRERCAMLRGVLEITGRTTLGEAFEQIRIWKGKIDASSSDN